MPKTKHTRTLGDGRVVPVTGTPGAGGGAPALEPGKTRKVRSISLPRLTDAKLLRISGGNPSEFVRNIIDSWPEGKR